MRRSQNDREHMLLLHMLCQRSGLGPWTRAESCRQHTVSDLSCAVHLSYPQHCPLMAHDPYAPPQAVVADPTVALAARPKAVIVLFVAGYTFLLSAIASVLLVVWALFDPARRSSSLSFASIRFGVTVAVLILLAVMLFSVHRRSRIGQVLGAMFILLVGAAGLTDLLSVVPHRATDSLPYLMGVYSFHIGFGALVAYWLYAFALSAKARAYFG